jgi:hypothetical protein
MAMYDDTIEPTQENAAIQEDVLEVIQEDGVTAEANPPCVALVPVTETAHWSHPVRPLPRPNSNFVTQLIATVEQAPQTRNLRRATASDAQAAYTSSRQRVSGAGLKARQTA